VAPVVGTERLGRPFNDQEKKRFAALLREHDFVNARLAALLFARKKTRTNAAAEDLVGRACLRLVRWGWDPNEVPLKKRLLRLVWSEWTHQLVETKTEADAVQVFLREQAIHETLPPSPEAEALSREAQLAEQERSEKAIERLRAVLVEAGDTVNLLWLDFTLQGKHELTEMAEASGRKVDEFYNAAKRRSRIVARLVAEQQGIKDDEGDRSSRRGEPERA
jgi:DNA-directed RNA polymerase specialized sigma24 family protein